MRTKEKALQVIGEKGEITPQDLARAAGVSRQRASKVIGELKAEGVVLQVGRGPRTIYILPGNERFSGAKYAETFQNEELREDEIVSRSKMSTPFLQKLPSNLDGIFDYAFSKILNNAIEHSGSEKIKVEVGKEENFLTFTVRDFGIGVFKNIMQKKGLNSETEAIQDLLKGKTTTLAEAHSGEGIFFTSRAADIFILESFNYKLQVDNLLEDIFVAKEDNLAEGTRVVFRIDLQSEKELVNIFRNYQTIDAELGFDKTEIVIKLYKGDIDYVSRSQARRVLVGLENFRKIILDFKDISGIGQAFSDEIFRVFKGRHSEIEIEARNANEAVQFMIKRTNR